MKFHSFESPLFTPILDQVYQLVPYDQSSIYLLDGGYLKYMACRGVLPPEQVKKLNFPIEKTGGAYVAIQQNVPVLVADVKGDTVNAVAFQESARVAPDNTFDFIGSWIGFPLQVGGQTIGLIDLCHRKRNNFTEEHVKILQNYFEKAAPAIESAILMSNLQERSSELETLMAVQQAIHSHLDLPVMLQLIADQAQRLTSARQILVFLKENDRLTVVASAGDAHSNIQPGFMLPPNSTLVAEAFRKNQPVRILNVLKDDRVDQKELLSLGIRSMLVVPLNTGATPFGLLMAIHNYNSAFSPNDEHVLSMLAAGASIGIDNAQLYREEQQRRFTAEGMQDILSILSSSQMLPDILRGVASKVVQVLQADAGAIYLIHAKEHSPQLMATHLVPDNMLDDLSRLTTCYSGQIDSHGKRQTADHLQYKIASTILMNNLSGVAADPDLFKNEPEKKAASLRFAREYESVLHISFAVQNEILGFMNLFYKASRKLNPEELRLAETIGGHIALTIDRDRLSQKAEELVRLQERQRIAQTLHDTVTQILFRAGLETKWVLQNQPIGAELTKRIQTIQHLITRSSYELRSAIFALSNSEFNQNHSLVDLLQAQVTTFQNEFGINTTLIAPDDLGKLSLPVTEAIYRLVREAMTNIYKHANATAAFVSISRNDDSIMVTIQDDGYGLPSDVRLDSIEGALHFGVNSMRQMVLPFGGEFSIENNDDHGVIVKAIFPAVMKENE